MSTKYQIINNLREYSASEIVHAIKCGEVSMYELSKSGKMTPLMKKRIEEQMAYESVEIHATSSVIESSEEIIPSVNENLEKQAVADAPTQTDIPSIPVITPVISSQSTEIDYEILDNSVMFKRVFSFKGRIRRTEYGLSYIIYCIWYVILNVITEVNDINPAIVLFAVLSMVPAFWFFWAQGTKRCHDRGNSGWYQIIPFYFFVMIFGGSEEGVNDYGTNPKE